MGIYGERLTIAELKNNMPNDGLQETAKRIANNTLEYETEDGSHCILFHETEIIRQSKDGLIQLNSGGYKTLTTKGRMNDFLNEYRIGLYSEDHVWSLNRFGDWDNSILFDDFMRIDPDTMRVEYPNGKPIDPKEQKKQIRRIKKYAADFIKAFAEGKIEKPGPGDCFFCAMREVETHKPLGEVTKDVSHLEEHIREKYYVPSLLYRVYENRTGLSLFALDWMSRIWANDSDILDYANIGREQAQKALEKYLFRQFGIA